VVIPERGPDFRPRSTEVTRIEGLSDACFGFAITLLIVSLEVPRNFGELADSLRGFLPFAISFAMLVWIWHTQRIFFRRYGLQDNWTITLNAALLFVVLFYIYPLKFLFNVLIDQFAGRASVVRDAGGAATIAVQEADGSLRSVIGLDQFPTLMAVYSIGFIAMRLAFYFMHRHAWNKRHEIQLNEFEQHDTRVSMREDLILITVGIVSLAMTTLGDLWTIASGWIYGLIGPAMALNKIRSEKVRRQIATSSAVQVGDAVPA
jgi:hypothetical protein